MENKITLADIAKQAGVSKQTVSRVINDNPDVSVETRKRIQAIIDSHGYKPNVFARGLSARQTFTIGLISSRLEYNGPRSMLASLDFSAHRAGYRLIPHILHEDNAHEVDKHLQTLIALQPDGIIWEAAGDPKKQVSIGNNEITSSLPIITIYNNLVGVPNVLDIKDTDASRRAVEHLIREGYKNIGIITGPSNWYSTVQRLEGWKIALQENGLPAEKEQIVEGDWTPKSGMNGVIQLLDQFPRLDAVFACNDQMALGTLSELNKRGIRVPQDIGVVGYDDIAEAEFFSPSLTTVRQPFDRYGKELVRIIVKMIKDNVKFQEFTFPEAIDIFPELIIRNSSKRGSE
jgi:DNA-binding LacI/PurR family transcriptional regulator